MKKISKILLLFLLAFVFVGCNKDVEKQYSFDKDVKYTNEITDQSEMVRTINDTMTKEKSLAKGEVTVTMDVANAQSTNDSDLDSLMSFGPAKGTINIKFDFSALNDVEEEPTTEQINQLKLIVDANFETTNDNKTYNNTIKVYLTDGIAYLEMESTDPEAQMTGKYYLEVAAMLQLINNPYMKSFIGEMVSDELPVDITDLDDEFTLQDLTTLTEEFTTFKLGYDKNKNLVLDAKGTDEGDTIELRVVCKDNLVNYVAVKSVGTSGNSLITCKANYEDVSFDFPTFDKSQYTDLITMLSRLFNR